MRQFGDAAMLRRPIVTLCALTLLGLLALNAPPTTPSAPAGARDVETYAAIVMRLRAGEPYYDAYGDELRRRAYPTRQAFNWRTPILLNVVAATPQVVSRALLIGLGIVLCIATVTALEPVFLALTAGMMQVGAVATISVSSAVLIGEAWAGVLIGLSVCAYLARRPAVAAALGLTALFIRELAGVYCVACAAAAFIDRRWREATIWIGGACLYAGFYLWHLTTVWAHQLPTDLAHASSWLQVNGVPFLLATIGWHAWLLMLPASFAVLAMVLIAAGVANPRAPFHVRLASGIYAVFFLLAGQRFNDYWGLLAWPTWAIACGYGVQCIVDAGMTATRLRAAHYNAPE